MHCPLLEMGIPDVDVMADLFDCELLIVEVEKCQHSVTYKFDKLIMD